MQDCLTTPIQCSVFIEVCDVSKAMPALPINKGQVIKLLQSSEFRFKRTTVSTNCKKSLGYLFINYCQEMMILFSCYYLFCTNCEIKEQKQTRKTSGRGICLTSGELAMVLKRWIALFTGEVTIQWIAWLVLFTLIH